MCLPLDEVLGTKMNKAPGSSHDAGSGKSPWMNVFWINNIIPASKELYPVGKTDT